MKPKLTNIFIDDIPGGRKSIRIDFDNDRHHASHPIAGDRDEVANALHALAAQLKRDEHLDGQNLTTQLPAAQLAVQTCSALVIDIKRAHDGSNPFASLYLSDLLRTAAELQRNISRYADACRATVAQTET